MTKPMETPIKPDGTITTQINNQTLIIEVFFNHDSNETFQDKLLRVLLAEERASTPLKKVEQENAVLQMAANQ
jgi:riboflavin synthase